jgi:hypothetical protein
MPTIRRVFLAWLFIIVTLTIILRSAITITNEVAGDSSLWYTNSWFDIDPSNLNLTIPSPSLFVSGTLNTTHIYRKALVLGHTTQEAQHNALDWLNTDLPGIDLYIYVANNRSAPLHPPRNKGHEAMIYTTFIIDHYDDLPDVMLFMHAHRRAWHNADVLGNDAAQMIRRLNAERVVRNGYVNMRCQWYPGCPDWMQPKSKEMDTTKKEQQLLARAWKELFPGAGEVPDVLAQPCCSQFALSRERVLALPRERYVQLRQWLMTTRLSDSISGRVFEYLWQYIFTGENVYCPVEHICYCDGFGVCFGGKAEYEAWHAARRERDRLNHELMLWEKKLKKAQLAVEKGMQTEWVDVDFPIEGRVEGLRVEIEKLQLWMSDRVAKAIERGDDIKNRDEEAGRVVAETRETL